MFKSLHHAWPALSALALAAALSSAPASAAVTNAATDFNTTTNSATGTWSYRTGSAPDGNYSLLPVAPGDGTDTDVTWSDAATGAPAPEPGAWNAADDAYPFIAANQGADLRMNCCGNNVLPANTLLVHPPDSGVAVVSWRADSDGTATASYRFADLEYCGDGIIWTVEHRDAAGNLLATVDTGSYGGGGSSGAGLTQGAPVEVAEGDYLHFVIDPNGGFACDETMVELAVSSLVPTTWDPSAITGNVSLSEGDLRAAAYSDATGSRGGVRSLESVSCGRYYWEMTVNVTGGSLGFGAGVGTPSAPLDWDGYFHGSNQTWGYLSDGARKHHANVFQSLGVSNTAVGDVLMLAVDLDTASLWIGRNGSWLGAGDPDPAAGTGAAYTNLAPEIHATNVLGFRGAGADVTANFGATAFAYTVPRGFTAGFGDDGTCGSADADADGVDDAVDNCPSLANTDQTDTDSDGEGDACDADDDGDGVEDELDNCQFTANADQSNIDGDAHGDACDADPDGDEIIEGDNCPLVPNAAQTDTDGDGQGDDCDADDDGDGICDDASDAPGCSAGPDNCPTVVNADQANLDGDGHGDACDADLDGDGIDNELDTCPEVADASNEDTDADGWGDACDDDDDNDGVLDGDDNCSLIVNADQADLDEDGQGDACDGDLDGDGFANEADNCESIPNGSQADFDGDGEGDACDADIDGDGVLNAADDCAGTELGAAVLGSGCSLEQLCPCDGPNGSSASWRNHGKYVSCNARATNQFVAAGLMTDAEKDEAMTDAAESDCGR